MTEREKSMTAKDLETFPHALAGYLTRNGQVGNLPDCQREIEDFMRDAKVAAEPKTEFDSRQCTCPKSAWIGSEPNDSTCDLTEEENENMLAEALPEAEGGAWEELRTGVYAEVDLSPDEPKQPPPRNPNDLPGPPEPPRPPRKRYVRSPEAEWGDATVEKLCNSRMSNDDSRSCFGPAVTSVRGLNFCAKHAPKADKDWPVAAPLAPQSESPKPCLVKETTYSIRVTREFVDSVEDRIGMGRNAWDMVDHRQLCEEVIAEYKAQLAPESDTRGEVTAAAIRAKFQYPDGIEASLAVERASNLLLREENERLKAEFSNDASDWKSELNIAEERAEDAEQSLATLRASASSEGWVEIKEGCKMPTHKQKVDIWIQIGDKPGWRFPDAEWVATSDGPWWCNDDGETIEEAYVYGDDGFHCVTHWKPINRPTATNTEKAPLMEGE